MVGRPSRKSEIGREDLLEVREWSGVPPKGLGVVGRPSQKFESGQEDLPEVRE